MEVRGVVTSPFLSDNPDSELYDVERRLREELREELTRFMGEQQLLTLGPEQESRIRTLIHKRVEKHGRDAANSSQPHFLDPAALERRIYDSLFRLGILQPLMDDPTVEEIQCNGPTRIFAVRNGESEFQSDLRFESDEELLRLIKRLIGESNQLDPSRPKVDAQLPDGSRLHAVIPPATVDMVSLTIRRFLVRADSLHDLVELGSIPPDAAAFLDAAVTTGVNMLISGSTASGKTTLLMALCCSITSHRERVITVEDTPELGLHRRLPNCVPLQARPANLEGKGELTIREHVRSSLRMRPTRIVVGEVRGAEALDMLMAMNTGHDGSIGTIHSNSPSQALDKLATYAMMAEERMPIDELNKTIAQNIELVLQLGWNPLTGKRQLTHIYEVAGTENGKILGQDLWAPDGEERSSYTGGIPRCVQKMKRKGVQYTLPPQRSLGR